MPTALKKRIVQFAWVVPTTFYVATMARSVGYVDAALVINNSYFPRLYAWVNYHNLFSIIGWVWMKIFPFGSEFFRINLLSGLFGAFTVYFIFRTCLEYTKTLWISAMAGLTLMTSHSLWWHSTMLEVYTLNTFLLALILFSVARYFSNGTKIWLYASLVFWGLGVSNHVLMGLLVLAFVLLVIIERKNLSLLDVGIGIAFLLVGLTVFIVAFARSYARHESFLTVLNMVTGGDFRSLMFTGTTRLFWRVNYLIMLVYQYPSLIIFYLVYGTVFLFIRREKLDLIILASVVPLAVWSASYFVWDMYAFALPVYVLLTLSAAKGLLLLKNRRRLAIVAGVTMIIPLFLYTNIYKVPVVQKYIALYDAFAMVEDSFDPASYFLNPVKTRFDDVDEYVQALFDELPEDSLYFDNVHDYPIHYYYQDIRGERPDLNCPIVFVFWVTDKEIADTTRRINSYVSRGSPVFVAPFMFKTTRSGLKFANSEELMIAGRLVYRLY